MSVCSNALICACTLWGHGSVSPLALSESLHSESVASVSLSSVDSSSSMISVWACKGSARPIIRIHK